MSGTNKHKKNHPSGLRPLLFAIHAPTTAHIKGVITKNVIIAISTGPHSNMRVSFFLNDSNYIWNAMHIFILLYG